MATTTPVPKKILVFGATGQIGKPILEALIASKLSFEKVGMFTSQGTVERKAKEIGAVKGQGIEVIVGDVSSEDDVRKAYQGYDTVISAVGRDGILTQLPLLKLAESTPSIHTFYPSEFGTDIEYSPATSPHEPPHQLKLQVRKYIREQTSRLNVTYLVTGPYPEFYLTNIPWDETGSQKIGSWDPVGKRAVLLGDGKGKVSFTSMPDVGRLLVAALKTPQGPGKRERALKVNSFTASPEEILRAMERATGDGKWEVEYTGLEELKALERKAYEEKNPRAVGITLKRIWTEGGTLYERRGNADVGEPKVETLEELVQRVLKR